MRLSLALPCSPRKAKPHRRSGGARAHPMAMPQRPRPRPRPQLARINAMKHASYPAEDEGPDDSGAELGSECESQTSFRIRVGRGGGAEVADLFRKLGLSVPEDLTIPPAIYAAAMAHLPNSRSRRQSLEASLGPSAGADNSAPPEIPVISGRDVVVAARLDAAEVREEAALAAKLVQSEVDETEVREEAVLATKLQSEVAEASAQSYEAAPAESSNRAVELDIAKPSRPEVAAVVKEGNADKDEGEGDAVKVDRLRVERRKVVVVEASRETTGAVVQVVTESTSRDIERLISPSPHRRFKRTITSWLKGHHLGSVLFGSVYEAISERYRCLTKDLMQNNAFSSSSMRYPS